jgi:hypothetical protein
MIPDFAAISGIPRAQRRMVPRHRARREPRRNAAVRAAFAVQPLTLQQRAMEDSHINGSKGKEIPELTTQSGIRANGYHIDLG